MRIIPYVFIEEYKERKWVIRVGNLLLTDENGDIVSFVNERMAKIYICEELVNGGE